MIVSLFGTHRRLCERGRPRRAGVPPPKGDDREQTSQVAGRAQAQGDPPSLSGTDEVHRRPRPELAGRENSKTELRGSACCLGFLGCGHAGAQVGTVKSPSVSGDDLAHTGARAPNAITRPSLNQGWRPKGSVPGARLRRQKGNYKGKPRPWTKTHHHGQSQQMETEGSRVLCTRDRGSDKLQRHQEGG